MVYIADNQLIYLDGGHIFKAMITDLCHYFDVFDSYFNPYSAKLLSKCPLEDRFMDFNLFWWELNLPLKPVF
jgi:hypothetical protein